MKSLIFICGLQDLVTIIINTKIILANGESITVTLSFLPPFGFDIQEDIIRYLLLARFCGIISDRVGKIN